MTDFLECPHTPHLLLLAPKPPRSDKVLGDDEVSEFLSGDVVIEETVDGANVGISVDSNGELWAQDRGPCLGRRAHPRYQPRWCFATHSVEYDALPEWFLGFEVYDRPSSAFLPTGRRDELLHELGVCRVPAIARGRFTREALVTLLGRSRVGDTAMDGLYVRREDAERLVARAKIVRPEFVQSIDEHWSRQPLWRNRLAETVRPARQASATEDAGR